MFYIQLDSSMHGLGNGFSFYTVRSDSSYQYCININSPYQIVILNGGNFIGRFTAGFVAARCGISNGVIGSTLGSAIVTFAMMTLSTRAGAANIGLFFGYFSGLCQ